MIEVVRIAGVVLVVLYGMAGVYLILLFQSWAKKGVKTWMKKKKKIKR